MHRTKFIPRIMICDDDADFFAQVADRPYRIVGHAKIFGEVDGQSFNISKNGKVFFNDKLQDFTALKNFLLGGEVDYLVFTKFELFVLYHKVAVANKFVSPKAVTIDQFNTLPREFFCDANIPLRILDWTKHLSIGTLLDLDGYFAASGVFNKPGNDFTQIDCVTDKALPPLAENIYRRVYKNLAQVGLQRYDAVFMTERSPQDFDAAFTLTQNIADGVLTFCRTGFALERHIYDTKRNFKTGKGFHMMTGNLIYVTRRKPPESFRMFVVTHKKTPHEGKLPDGYEIIHAGHAHATEDFGYRGDDTGDNVSDINLYINELTALYWFWKNTSHTIVGLCHYRRFFTTGNETFAYEKILTQADALKILRTHDIIVSRPFYGTLTQREFVRNDCGERLAKLGEAILRKHLLQVQPDYVDAFDFVLDSKAVYKCNMFVTRREVLDAFCKWLFSFLLDAVREVLQSTELDKLSWTPRRLMSFLAERMLHVWLMRQRLRVKELNIMFIDGI